MVPPYTRLRDVRMAFAHKGIGYNFVVTCKYNEKWELVIKGKSKSAVCLDWGTCVAIYRGITTSNDNK